MRMNSPLQSRPSRPTLPNVTISSRFVGCPICSRQHGGTPNVHDRSALRFMVSVILPSASSHAPCDDSSHPSTPPPSQACAVPRQDRSADKNILPMLHRMEEFFIVQH